MKTVETIYLGELRTEATHVRSGTTIITDAPVDNQGKGESFSPTDLVATALGSCMMTIVGIVARQENFNVDGTKLSITKVMAENPRRISEIIIDLDFPENNFTEKQKSLIEHAARTCPVAKSIHPDIRQTLSFNF
ncbi:MAG: OsmC family protein [Bacteroidetes bacterium]|nr:OsmC family protein [Bacteroidota bacterium]